ncbi:MAG: phosphatase PAP2 family protein [Acidimicrobiales bacterium]
MEAARNRRPVPLGRRRRVLRELARIFSTICNPFLTALALFVVVAHVSARSLPDFWGLLASTTFFTSIGPMLYVLWLYWTERIADLDMSERGERERVFGVFVVFYALGTLVLYLAHAPALATASLAGYTAAAIVVQNITRYWKISTHALGITAPFVVLIYLYGWQPLPFAVLVPIVCWSRVYLRAHTVAQVLAGTALGAGSVLLFFHVFRLI